MYRVKEIYYTLQGEGARAGRPAVLCRFAGCNLWTGLERDRHRALCQFCDTDFVGTDGPGGGRFATPEALAHAVVAVWTGQPHPRSLPYVVCTGGEPALQMDAALIAALHAARFSVAIETNGTLPLPAGLDWVCVSPKAGAALQVLAGDELKLVWCQPDAQPHHFAGLDFDRFWLQPMDGPVWHEHAASAVEYCLQHPQWSLSLQTHKFLDIR